MWDNNLLIVLTCKSCSIVYFCSLYRQIQQLTCMLWSQALLPLLLWQSGTELICTVWEQRCLGFSIVGSRPSNRWRYSVWMWKLFKAQSTWKLVMMTQALGKNYINVPLLSDLYSLMWKCCVKLIKPSRNYLLAYNLVIKLHSKFCLLSNW